MAANPIYIESEEEIAEVIERIRRSAAPEVPLVLPARSRLGQSRFNFQLLKQYANRLEKQISIISADPAVQQMAEESGFPAYRGVDQHGLVPAGPPAPAAAQVARAAAPAATAPRIRVAAPAKLQSKLATEIKPGRFLLYVGSFAILAVGLLGLVLYVPSAQVTLVASATPFATDNVTLNAAPGQAPIRVRTVSVSKSMSGSFKGTGTKSTPAAVATGQIAWTNKCGPDLVIREGATVAASSGGAQFRQKGDVIVPNNGAAGASIVAVQPGAAWNVGAGAIDTIVSTNPGTCLKVSNAAATSGGADEQKQPQIQQADYEAARSGLEQQLRSQIADDLAKQAGSGEKLSDAIQFDTPDFATDHKVGETVAGFNGTMTLKAEGAFYATEDVTKAFSAALARKVPAGRELVPGKTGVDYSIAGSPGGNLTFTGSVHGFTAPTLDQARVKGRLVARSLGQATSELSRLPGVTSAEIKESPARLPIMPLVSSRISLRYEIRQGAVVPKSG